VSVDDRKSDSTNTTHVMPVDGRDSCVAGIVRYLLKVADIPVLLTAAVLLAQRRDSAPPSSRRSTVLHNYVTRTTALATTSLKSVRAIHHRESTLFSCC